MQPACKSTMIAGQNIVLPRGLDLRRCPVGRELEHKNGLVIGIVTVMKINVVFNRDHVSYKNVQISLHHRILNLCALFKPTVKRFVVKFKLLFYIFYNISSCYEYRLQTIGEPRRSVRFVDK